jgi:hypothetical protein
MLKKTQIGSPMCQKQKEQNDAILGHLVHREVGIGGELCTFIWHKRENYWGKQVMKESFSFMYHFIGHMFVKLMNFENFENFISTNGKYSSKNSNIFFHKILFSENWKKIEKKNNSSSFLKIVYFLLSLLKILSELPR